jgi:hypothetical protein
VTRWDADTVTTQDETPDDPAGLRAERDAVLEIIADLPDDDPELPGAWADAGLYSYQLFFSEGDERDLRLAGQALAQALADPADDHDDWYLLRVVLGHVLALSSEADEERTGPALLDAVAEWTAAGLAALDGKPGYDDATAVGRFLMAQVAKARCEGNPDPAAVEAALAAHQEALERQEEGGPEWVTLHHGHTELLYARARAGGGRPDFLAAAGHCRAALAATPEGPEQAPLRYDLALTLLHIGMLDQDRGTLQQARDEFDAAVVVAAPGPPPWWDWQARVFSVYIRGVLWWQWQEHSQASVAARQLDSLLGAPRRRRGARRGPGHAVARGGALAAFGRLGPRARAAAGPAPAAPLLRRRGPRAAEHCHHRRAAGP